MRRIIMDKMLFLIRVNPPHPRHPHSILRILENGTYFAYSTYTSPLLKQEVNLSVSL